MKELVLTELRIEKLAYENNIIAPVDKGTFDVQIKTRISSTVQYNQEQKLCKCTSSAELYPSDEAVNFRAETVVTGIFACDNMDDRKELHVEASRKLFPYLQTTTTSLMTLAGIPNFLIKEPPFTIDGVTENRDGA